MIELLITIAVIGALASIGLITFTGQQKSARDAQRKSDLQQYRIALENYANATNTYPNYETSSISVSTTLCTALGSNFIAGCSEDPMNSSDSTFSYKYQGGGSGWALWAKLERSGKYWVFCSNGKSGELTAVTFSGGCVSGL